MPRLRQAFEPRRTVNTITVEIPILDSMSPKLTRPELDAVVRRYLRVPFGYLSLQRAGIPYITLLNWTRKLGDPAYGFEHSDNKDYFIDRCDYDQARVILQHIYGALRARNDDNHWANSSPLTSGSSLFRPHPPPTAWPRPDTPICRRRARPWSSAASMSHCTAASRIMMRSRTATFSMRGITNGPIPSSDQPLSANNRARSCDQFRHAVDPYGCWDWWGYTDFNYVVKAGR